MKEYKHWNCGQPDWIKIDNIKEFNLDEVKIFHPQDPRYVEYWKQEKKYCIEGRWERQFGGWMHMPGCLYFYGKFGIIVDTDKFTKVTEKIKPLIQDLEFEQAFMFWEARGFSGYIDDDEYTSDNMWFKFNEKGLPTTEEIEKMGDSQRTAVLNLINNNGNLKEYLTPRKNLRRIAEKPLGRPLFQNDAKNKDTMGCHAKDSKFRMYDGSVKEVFDIKIGDALMGPDSSPREVNEILTGENVMVKITPKYGDAFKITPNHILRVRETNKHTNEKLEYDLPVWEYLNKSDSKKSFIEIIDRNKIEYPEVPLVLDPYFIGLWLGDGFKREKLICINQGKDKEILNWLLEYCNSKDNLSYTTSVSKNGLSNGFTTRFRLTDSNLSGKGNYWAKTFRNNKHIPNEYLINSLDNRLKLLAGYIDSDGCYEKKSNRYTITSVDLDLLTQTQELARSCGFRAEINKPSKTGITDSLKYNLRIIGDINSIPVKLSYKKATGIREKFHRNTFTTQVLPPEKFYGVEVDKDHLYMLADGNKDHNSRGGGKSFFEAVAVQLYTLTFDGATEYIIDQVQKVETCIGSGDTDKSGELVQKVVDAMNEFAINPKLGAWGQQGDSDWTPNPFYRDMNGPTNAGNKQKGGWVHKYEKKINGRWVDGFGTGTRMFHVSYSSNKKAGAEAGAGGRYNVSTVEEKGLTILLIMLWNSNRATVMRNGVQFGVQSFLGTSGNAELVLPSKEMFTTPHEFNLVAYPDVWEGTGDLGFFIPAYMTYRQFKDVNGNTDVKAAREHWLKGYLAAGESANPKTLRMYCMNYPDIPSHMWVTDAQYLLPYEEAIDRERHLMDKKLYQTIGTAIDLRWDTSKQNGVTYDIVHNPQPFYDFPIRKDMERMDGEIMMYQTPQEIRGVVPNDMYFFVHDPYVSDNQEDGASLGVTYGFLNPKYSVTHDGSQLVCSYIGKPKGGKKAYYQNLEKLLAFYGNPFRGLAYEANRGEYCRSYFEKKGKLHLLALRPQHAKGDGIYEKNVTQFGYMVGARGAIGKLTMVDDTNDFLLSDVVRSNGTNKLIETIPCIFLIRQIAQFTLNGNFDAVSSLILVPTFISEQESYMTQIRKQKETNRLQFLSTNSAIHDKNNRHKGKGINRLI